MASATRLFLYEYLSAGGDPSPDSIDLLDEGTAMRDALASDFAALDDVVVTRATCESDRVDHRSSRIVDASPHDDESATAFVARNALAHDLALIVAPETGGILAALHEVVPGERWLGCTHDAIAIASSKSSTTRRLDTHGIATPASLQFGARNDDDTQGWIVKPDDGAGCVDTKWFESFGDACKECDRRRGDGESAELEPWIAGDALSLSLMCARDRTTLLAINRQHIEIGAQRDVRYRGVSIAALAIEGDRALALTRLALDVRRAIPGLYGFVGVDVVWHPQHGPVVIEVNPRITCAYVGMSAALGRNLAADMLASHREHALG